MKKLLAIALCLPLVAAAQKKSGAVYSEHPALTVVEDMNAAFCAGDLETYETYFEPEVKIWSVGDEEPHGLERDLQISEWWNKNFDVSITRASGASPDVVEYDGDSKGAWVMDWTEFMAIHKVSGDTVKTWMHDEYFVSDGGKITTWFSYYDGDELGRQIQDAFGAHRNGRIYDEHPFIDILLEVVNAWEDGDVDAMSKHFADDCTFHRLGEGDGYRDETLAFRQNSWANGIASTSSRKMNVYGYPDAIRYEKGDGGWEVMSWWNHTFVDAETGAEQTVFLHLSHSFNNEGKISREVLWVD